MHHFGAELRGMQEKNPGIRSTSSLGFGMFLLPFLEPDSVLGAVTDFGRGAGRLLDIGDQTLDDGYFLGVLSRVVGGGLADHHLFLLDDAVASWTLFADELLGFGHIVTGPMVGTIRDSDASAGRRLTH